MKCPNCGAEMPKEALYCEHCGKDIQVVPDYEPELEANMARAIGHPLEEGEERGEERKKSRKYYFFRVLTGICLAGVLLAGTVGGVFLFQYDSYDYQVKKGNESLRTGKFEKAAACFERAAELRGDDVELLLSLAEAYLGMGNGPEYERLLQDLAQDPRCSKEQLERVYGKIIALYLEKGEYDAVNEFLHKSGSEILQKKYQGYFVNPPEFTYSPGYYEEPVPLKLFASSPGKIYYTLDGTDPDESSELYSAPFLFTESVKVKAIFINEYGVESDIATAEYFINPNADPH